MPPLTAIERFFERLFERPSARLFRTRLQPVQLQRRIERAMEAERLAASDRTLVPNRFVVHLHPDDLAGFDDMEQTLAAELADAALLFARAHHYTLVDRPRVDLLGDVTVLRADIRVDARFADPIAGRAPVMDDDRRDERERGRPGPHDGLHRADRRRAVRSPSGARAEGRRPRGLGRRGPHDRPRHRQRPRPP